MTEEQAFLDTILANPHDWAPRLIFADWLDEHGDPRGELVRLLHWLHLPENVRRPHVPVRRKRENRLRELVEGGVPWIGPYLKPGLHMKFSLIPPGTFLMGSPPEEEKRLDDEHAHTVTLARGFWIAVYPVTQLQWSEIMRSTPSHFQGEILPVEQVSWADAQEFCRNFGDLIGGRAYLPSEAQWEYACRAGTTTTFYFGNALNGSQANCNGNFPYRTTKKGRHLDTTLAPGAFQPNAFDLYDMHGNVQEWCEDWYGAYGRAPTNGEPQLIKESSDYRVLRGGSCQDVATNCRAARRLRHAPDVRTRDVGFRVCIRLD
jgi:uncharacterized protein (TIGR02996 family)